ncbi:MAG: RHS repeat-associated core domain-containing protein, partial [Coriobacteriia bacterium]
FAYLCDRAGSVVALTDSSGAVVASYAYDPWGAPTSQPASGIGARNPLRYRGYYYDVATALYYLPARYYDPAVARFLSPDPAAPSAGDPLSLNRYAYCVGDPVNADDPSGAIMDSDGNGKLDDYDHNLAMEKAATNPTVADYYGAKAKVAYYSANGTAQQLVKAQVALYNITGWPSFEEFLSGSQAPMGDGTPFGRNNRNWMPSRPDDTTWMLGGIGALSDVLTPLFGPAWVIPAATGLVINGGYAVWHYQPLREQGRATWGDVFWTGVGAVPIIGIVPSVVTVIGYDFIHWAEPSN